MLTVSDLTFSYPTDDRTDAGPEVLQGANLQLTGGCSVGLLGANGSGKSTMLGAITNAIFGVRSGAIQLAAAAVGPIGFATQNPALYQHLSVRENLDHAARLATGRWEVTALVDQAIDEYRLAHILPTVARHLSGGQTRIAHLACSFVHRPTVRLLDEPTTALDFETRQLLVELVHSWRSEGIATLVTAHYPEDIEELCTELVVLVDGHTHALGSIDDHLRSLGTTASVQTNGTTHQLQVRGGATLAGLTEAAGTVAVRPNTPLERLHMSPPSLRDVLRLDPSLRNAVADTGQDNIAEVSQ